MPRRLATLASRAQRTVTDYVTDVLVRQGVKNVFGGHGGAVIPLVGSIATRSDLNWVYMRNEQAASLAAAADAKLTGRLGVCVATSGPGSSHLTTGLIDALQDRCPVLALTGTKATSAVDLSEFQMIHQEQLFRAAGLPFSNVVMSEAAIPAMLRNAIAIALREKTAVHLALPVDIQSRLIAPPRGGSHGAAEISQIEYQASEARLMTAANAMRDPQMRVVIALGHRAATELDHEGHDSRHANPYVRLAETLNAPIVTQLDAKGCVDESHPLSYGVIGVFGNPGLDAARTLVTSADLVLLFGVDRQAVDLIADAAFNQVRRVVEFEPDAGSAAYHRWYECEAVVIGKLGANARRLEAAVANLRASAEAAESYRQLESARPINSFHSHWTWLLTAGWREAGANSLIEAPSTERRPSRFQIEHEEPAGFCHPARVLQALSALLKPDDVVCVDTGDITLWASLCLCLSGEQRVLSSQGMGTMGYALPAAIAAALQRPHRNVVAIAGDGGVQSEARRARTGRCARSWIACRAALASARARAPDPLTRCVRRGPARAAVPCSDDRRAGDGQAARRQPDADHLQQQPARPRALWLRRGLGRRHRVARLRGTRARLRRRRRPRLVRRAGGRRAAARARARRHLSDRGRDRPGAQGRVRADARRLAVRDAAARRAGRPAARRDAPVRCAHARGLQHAPRRHALGRRARGRAARARLDEGGGRRRRRQGRGAAAHASHGAALQEPRAHLGQAGLRAARAQPLPVRARALQTGRRLRHGHPRDRLGRRRAQLVCARAAARGQVLSTAIQGGLRGGRHRRHRWPRRDGRARRDRVRARD
jgi:pyruvate dehydrogenase (quinone)/pyruvate oxidase